MADSAEFGTALDHAQADGRISVDDADTLRDFAAFLTDPSSRCAICLTDDLDGATWKRHEKLGRFPICRQCGPPADEVGAAPTALLFCRECAEGKHRNCDGSAWSNEADATVTCTCPDPKHMSGRAASAITDLVVDDAERRGL